MAKPSKNIQPPKPPKGTRDLYPDDVLKRRYIQNAWRDASLRCGFDEIEGPTFESTDLYSIKSGEGILGELFQTFSGKGGQETLDKLVERGQADFALRPEFTPTLARMYAARAKQLPKPCKWFTAGPYFRAERPQRGRLREFLQWNCDIIGLPSEEDTPQTRAEMDAEILACNTLLFQHLGFNQSDISLRINSRTFTESTLILYGVRPDTFPDWFNLLDKINKVSRFQYMALAAEIGESSPTARKIYRAMDKNATTLEGLASGFPEAHKWIKKRIDTWQRIGDEAANSAKSAGLYSEEEKIHLVNVLNSAIKNRNKLRKQLDLSVDNAFESVEACRHILELGKTSSFSEWLKMDESIVRGLAYYTGTVFEAIADGERAVAGGGRYDNLIELMGGPPTPAVGFAMGDVVLGNLLDDKHLMPEGQDLKEAVARQQTSIRPEAFIAVPNNDEENKSAAQSLTAALRRGQESDAYLSREDRKPWQSDRYRIAPLHTRISYKSTTNPGKLRKDAEKQHAKYFIEIHAPNKVELTDMDKRESITSPTHGSFSTNPADENYIGTALADLT